MWGFSFEEHTFHGIPNFAKEDLWKGCGRRAKNGDGIIQGQISHSTHSEDGAISSVEITVFVQNIYSQFRFPLFRSPYCYYWF
jgi:hypothetical protein